MIKSSYTSASTLPSKLIKQKEECITENGITPYHVQLCPTNRCNLNCSFCSCADRDKSLELDPNDLFQLLPVLKRLGTKSFTITGGGDPCIYPHLSSFLFILNELDMNAGLVTNGIALEKVKKLDTLTWCRVSVSDERDTNQLFEILSKVIPENPNVDWAFSYVVTKDYDFQKIVDVIKFANKYKMTHVRLVTDLLDTKEVTSMEIIENRIKGKGINDSIVIYQDRKKYDRGATFCHISLLKPVIGPDGFLYPCCGVQYAQKDNDSNFPENMRMCHISEIEDYYTKQLVFDGRKCDVCYYTDYNSVLEICTTKMNHEVFV